MHGSPALSPPMHVFTHVAWATRAGRAARPPPKPIRHDLPSSAEDTASFIPENAVYPRFSGAGRAQCPRVREFQQPCPMSGFPSLPWA